MVQFSSEDTSCARTAPKSSSKGAQLNEWTNMPFSPGPIRKHRIWSKDNSISLLPMGNVASHLMANPHMHASGSVPGAGRNLQVYRFDEALQAAEDRRIAHEVPIARPSCDEEL